jgi:hypothetical protein
MKNDFGDFKVACDSIDAQVCTELCSKIIEKVIWESLDDRFHVHIKNQRNETK